MGQEVAAVDQLYLNAESLSQDFSLFPRKEPASVVKGLLTGRQIEQRLEQLRNMEVDEYIAATVSPTEESTRPGARELVRHLGVPVFNEVGSGPFYACELDLPFPSGLRRIGLIAQDRAHNTGVWGPEHHEAAALKASEFAVRSLPIVTFMDTPGADPYEEANANNQAHSISRLIAELCNVDVPTIGIIIGQGYSGGAIPLAASNLLLSVRTGVFNTIHPRSLANLVRRYNLSWQECAKFVGVSSFELYKQGMIDGIIDFDPGEEANIGHLRDAMITGILSIEDSTRAFVATHPEILDHYHRNLNRYLNPSETQTAVHASSTLKLRTAPTEWPNVFGVAFRYLRYLNLRRRIKATTTTQYGRLADSELPPGELAERIHRERRVAFLTWLQDPDKVLYEDSLNKAWKHYQDKRQEAGDERGRIAQLFFGDPGKNFDNARRDMILVTGLHLYNRWKASARDNLGALIDYLNDQASNNYLIATSEIQDVQGLLTAMSAATGPFVAHLKSLFSFEGRKLFDDAYIAEKNPEFLRSQLASELNLILEGPSLYDEARLGDHSLSPQTTSLIGDSTATSTIPLNRRLLEDTLWSHLERKSDKQVSRSPQDQNILDVILDEDIRAPFQQECRNLVFFSYLYDQLISELVEVARQAIDSRSLNAQFLSTLLDHTAQAVEASGVMGDAKGEDLKADFAEWLTTLSRYSGNANFLKSVEEWMRVVHKDKSDTLFVVISHIFERLLPEYYASQRGGRRFAGKLEPARIGRRKDFWNRLTIAYRDLLFNEVLTREKRSGRTTADAIVAKFVQNFEETNSTLMSANPVSFPTFRPSIESALKKGVRPHGLITGIGDFTTENGSYRAGFVVSNVAFQAGSIDNSDCVRFCKLLLDCAIERLPVICFISSGGMQTKEGAAALFTMAVVNDRITRFVRDNDLPIIMFGFGDCTGGAQASFVTHPLVQTYYFSGSSMPFAGQAVVERNLPYTCLLSNYLSVRDGSMQGLVQHPFAEDLDNALRRVDPDVPLPAETVEQVVERIMSGTLVGAAPAVRRVQVSEEDLIRPIKRTLVHARGCTAVKLVGKALEFGHEVVLIQSDPDMESVPADMVRDHPNGTLVNIGGNTSDESYLNALSVVSVAESEQVDSLHPGIGFLSEDPNFANLVRQHGVNFIGPRVSSMETMGNKSNAISTTMSNNVPVVPGSHGIVGSSELAAEIAERVGYPVLLKAVHGGGGKGIQAVRKPEELHRLYHQVTTEARAAFGNGDLYIEKMVTSLRHIEAQILRDTHGNTHVIGIRDCSVQRNNQKLMEESGSTMLPDELKAQVLDYARRIADAVNYTGAGTVEFIFDVPSNAVYFMEMNTRLQVEHPVTEAVTGVDIVRKQFEIAAGGSIADLEYGENGYALEVRVNAEKAVIDSEGRFTFVPTPGEITRCEFPEHPDVTLIAMAAEGKVVSPFYDSLVAQIIITGKDRNDTIAKMYDYLGDVTIHGISTNISLIRRILKDEQFIGGEYDTGYLPAFLGRIDAGELISEIEKASGMDGAGLDIEMLRIENSNELKVLAPSTGVFYRTPSPSEPEFVNVGDVVSTEDVLCQLEAMKMFAPVALSSFAGGDGELYDSAQHYRINRINVSTGQQVNEGDLLFVVEAVAEPAGD